MSRNVEGAAREMRSSVSRSSSAPADGLSLPLLAHSQLDSSASEIAESRVAPLPHLSDEAHDTTRARQASHFAMPSINPRSEFFHLFISYRVADDEELVKSLYSKIQLDSKNHAIPLLEYSKFPHQFHKDASNTADVAAHVFVSSRCLPDGERWEWDPRTKGGFVGALVSSCLFVPVFSLGLDDQKTGHDPAKVGNVARFANLGGIDQPSKEIDTWIAMAPATQGSSAYLCFETDSHSNKHVFLDGGVVQFDSLPNCDLPPSITKGKQYFLVHAKYGPRAHRKFQRFWVSELKGGAPLALQACSTKFKTRIFPSDWVDNVLLELLLAKEMHEQTKLAEKQFGTCLRRCMTILPVVLCDVGELSDFINTFLSDKPSQKTNKRAVEILNDLGITPSGGLSINTSVKDILNWYMKFQCIVTKNIVAGDIVGNHLFSSEGDRASVLDHLLTVVTGKILHVVQRTVALGLMENFEGSNPQAHEMITWLRSYKLGYYGSIFAAHGISSVRAVSLLDGDVNIVPQLAEEGAAVTNNTVIAETSRLLGVIVEAKASELSLPLDKRAFYFKDSDASLLTMLYSSSAVILSLGNPLSALILSGLGIGWFVFTFIPVTHMDTFFVGSYGSDCMSIILVITAILSLLTSTIIARNVQMMLLWAFCIEQLLAYLFPRAFNDLEMLAATDDCASRQLSPPGSLVCEAYLKNSQLVYWTLLAKVVIFTGPLFMFSLTLWKMQHLFIRTFLVYFSAMLGLNLFKCYHFYYSAGFVNLVVPIFCFSSMAFASTFFEGGRKGVMIWSKKKVDQDALSYQKKIEQLGIECPTFEDDRAKLSAALEKDFKDVLQNSGAKQPVVQEMDRITTIYAHSEFVNNLFHDELTRIKDKCLADFVSTSPGHTAASSSTASIHASAPVLSRVSSSSPEPLRSASAPTRSASATQSTPRFLAESMGANLLLPQVSPTATSEAAARPAIELLRGPLKRPERAISKVYRCYKGIFSHLSDSVRCVVVCDSIKHIEEFMATLAKESFTRADKPPTILKRILRLAEVLLLGRGGARKNCANSWMEEYDEATAAKRFHVLRVKNRFDPSLDARPELLNGGYRDINIKLKIGFAEGKNGRAELVTVDKWSSDETDNRLVCEVQVRLRAFHELLSAKQDMHGNYVLMRNLMSS